MNSPVAFVTIRVAFVLDGFIAPPFIPEYDCAESDTGGNALFAGLTRLLRVFGRGGFLSFHMVPFRYGIIFQKSRSVTVNSNG